MSRRPWAKAISLYLSARHADHGSRKQIRTARASLRTSGDAEAAPLTKAIFGTRVSPKKRPRRAQHAFEKYLRYGD